MAARKSLTPSIFSYYTSPNFGYEKYNELRPQNQACPAGQRHLRSPLGIILNSFNLKNRYLKHHQKPDLEELA